MASSLLCHCQERIFSLRNGCPAKTRMQGQVRKTFIQGVDMNERQISELLLQSLEYQKCGVFIFEAALKCALDSEFREELEGRLKGARHGIDIFTEACFSLGMDPDRATPGRVVVRELGFALVDAMERASRAGPSVSAQLVACECITLAENKVQLGRELIGKCAENADPERRKVLSAVYAKIKNGEIGGVDYFHEWCRQLWAEALGMYTSLPLVQQGRYLNGELDGAVSGKYREPLIGASRF